jgi:hypothetical protein
MGSAEGSSRLICHDHGHLALTKFTEEPRIAAAVCTAASTRPRARMSYSRHDPIGRM